MLGNESGDMMLEQGLTRAQMAALLTRIVTDPEQFETDSAFYRSLCSFTDVPEWAKSYVGYCVANNLVVDYEKPGLEIIKKNIANGEPIEGVTYRIEQIDGSFSTSATTDNHGRIFLASIPVGSYKVTEINVPSHVILSPIPQEVALKAGETSTVTFFNAIKPSLEIRKLDSVTGDPVKGAKFQIWYGSNHTDTGELNDLGTYFSDASGKIILPEIKDGWYKVTELEPASGYAIKEPATQECFISGGESKVLTFENTPLSAIIIRKVDSESGQPLEGAWFRIRYLGGTSGTGGTVVGEYKTSSNGTIVATGLKAGTYVCEEISAPDGYVITDATETVYLSGKDQDVITVTFGNDKMGSLLIVKKDAVTGAPISDVEFFITDSDGSVIGNANGKYVTDSAGTIRIDGLTPGMTVIAREVRAKDGYILDDTPQSIKIKRNAVMTLEFRNQPKGGVLVKKVDAVTNAPIPDVEFLVTDSDGNLIGNANGKFVTDSAGTFTITDIAPGTTLIIKETRAKAGYRDLRMEDTGMDEIENSAGEKLHSFPALSRDIFQSFYSLMPRRNADDDLSVAARKINMPILEHITQSEDYPTLKAVCEGRELPAYEAAAEFTAQTSGELDNLLSQLGGKPGAVQTLEKLEQAEKTAEDKLAALLEQLRGAPQDDPALSAAVVKAANDAESKRRQADAVNKLVDAGLAQNQAEAGALIARAVSAAAERAEEVQTILGAWSDAPGDMRKTDANAALLERVRDSKTLQDISRYLGRFREIFAQGKRNGYAYGRGEKYALELGNDLSRALTSELAMLAVPETLPLFLRKYQHRQIKQYRRREPVYKGAGDIICCLDESGSTAGDLAAWGKAVALTLLEIAQSEGRKFALVHFSGPGRFQTDVFLPGQSSLEEKLHAAETFLGGGTDFQTPLAEAERLMREGGFENADIAFITDGECSLPETCVEMLQKAQSELRFTVTGILLDEGNAGMDFSLKPFCQNIYRTSELTGDQIVGEIVLDRV